MRTHLEYIVESISQHNPLHGKKLRKNLKNQDRQYFIRTEKILIKYLQLLEDEGKKLDYSINCYLEMLADMNFEFVQFLQTGEYSSKSFDEVNQRVYSNPEIMEYYMHGLLLSQFLWTHHYKILLYFIKVLRNNFKLINRYLEIGGGHGLHVSEAINISGRDTVFDLVDISKSSLEMTAKMVSNNKVNLIHSDIFDFFPAEKYDFISMGEVLEHMEEPKKLLEKAQTLLANNGKLFITVPTNAPAIDHIYLFKNANEIQEMIIGSGFRIEDELCVYSEDLPPDVVDRYKIPMMYACLLTKL